VLPTLLEKSLERGWRVVVQAARRSGWRRSMRICGPFATTSFLPHGTDREADAREQPIVLTVDDDNPNGATVRFLLDGAGVPATPPLINASCWCSTERIPTRSPPRARAGAKTKAAGFDVTYWQPDEDGAGNARPETARMPHGLQVPT